MTLPNFLIIGAAKSGTTSLYVYLQQHPQIFMSFPKEPHFFGNEGNPRFFKGPHDDDRAYHLPYVTDFNEYAALFDSVKGEKAIGSASIYSLYLPKAPEQIKKYIPKGTMFAVLRNPADRAFSAYLHTVRQGRERHSFEEALQQEPERIRRNWEFLWHFKTVGFYYDQIKRYYDTFDRSQLHVYLYDDLQKNALALIKEICEILEVDSSYVPDMSTRWNESRYAPKIPTIEVMLTHVNHWIKTSTPHLPGPLRWRAPRLRHFVDRVGDLNRKAPQRMAPETRVALLQDYREDILRLGDLLGRDLTHWLNPISDQKQRNLSEPTQTRSDPDFGRFSREKDECCSHQS